MQLNYRSYGAGPPLIILHGLFGSLVNWSRLSPIFSEQYHVFALDQRNHGSSPHSDTMDYTCMAEDLREFVQAAQLPAVHLLGHSMGGKTAMQFALAYPEQVNRLIVVDIAPRSYPPFHDAILDALCALDLAVYSSRAELDQALAPRIPTAAVRQFLLMNVARDEVGGFVWKINLAAIRDNYDKLTRGLESDDSFDGPALFIKGECSDYIQAEDSPLINQLFPQATITMIAGAGHWAHAEAPEDLTRLALGFLAK